MSGFQEQLLQQQQQQQQQRHWQSPSSLQQQQQNSFQHYGEIAGGNGSSGSSVSSVSGSGSLTGASFALHQHHNQHQHQQPFVFPQHQQQPPATTALNSSPFAGGSGAGTGGLQASSRVTRLSQSLPPLSPTASPAATVQPCPPPAAAAAAATPTGVGSGATIPSTELGGVGVAPRPFQLVQRALASSSSTSTSSASASPVAASPQSRNLFVDVQPAVYAPASSGATFPHAVGPRTPQLASSAAQPVPAEASVAVAAPSIHVTSDAASGGANTSSEPAASSTKDGSVVSQNPSHHTLPTATDRKTSGLSLHLPGASAAAGLPLPKTDNAGHTPAIAHHPVSPLLSGTPGTATVASRVVIVVRGHRYRVDPAMFQRYPDTMLARMFGSAFDMCKTNTTGEYEIEQPVSPAIFRAVLDYYATGLIVCPENEHVGDLREACDYFLLPFDMSTVRVQDLGELMHEMSNIGARKRFESFLTNLIMPAMAVSAEAGDRECYMVVLTDTDTIDWDDEDPPGVGEEHAQIIRSSALYRFLRFNENRALVKEVLKEKGLKKIVLGIEGFPTCKEKIKLSSQRGRREVVYIYEQRPFIRTSWIKEEHKSRHVDFQMVRTRSRESSIGNIYDNTDGFPETVIPGNFGDEEEDY